MEGDVAIEAEVDGEGGVAFQLLLHHRIHCSTVAHLQVEIAVDHCTAILQVDVSQVLYLEAHQHWQQVLSLHLRPHHLLLCHVIPTPLHYRQFGPAQH